MNVLLHVHQIAPLLAIELAVEVVIHHAQVHAQVHVAITTVWAHVNLDVVIRALMAVVVIVEPIIIQIRW
jgi:hypothetical protein